MCVMRIVRRMVTVAALGTLLLGSTAQLALAGPPASPPGQSVANYGTCVANPDTFPGLKGLGPLTINRNNYNLPTGHDSYAACVIVR